MTDQKTPDASGTSLLSVKLERSLPEPTAYIWVESWKDEDTQNGPGDYNEEVVFDTAPPTDGVRYSRLYTEEQVIELLRSNDKLRGAP